MLDVSYWIKKKLNEKNLSIEGYFELWMHSSFCGKMAILLFSTEMSQNVKRLKKLSRDRWHFLMHFGHSTKQNSFIFVKNYHLNNFRSKLRNIHKYSYYRFHYVCDVYQLRSVLKLSFRFHRIFCWKIFKVIHRVLIHKACKLRRTFLIHK